MRQCPSVDASKCYKASDAAPEMKWGHYWKMEQKNFASTCKINISDKRLKCWNIRVSEQNNAWGEKTATTNVLWPRVFTQESVGQGFHERASARSRSGRFLTRGAPEGVEERAGGKRGREEGGGCTHSPRLCQLYLLVSLFFLPLQHCSSHTQNGWRRKESLELLPAVRLQGVF